MHHFFDYVVSGNTLHRNAAYVGIIPYRETITDDDGSVMICLHKRVIATEIDDMIQIGCYHQSDPITRRTRCSQHLRDCLGIIVTDGEAKYFRFHSGVTIENQHAFRS